jgi:hypothetical protein
MTDALSPAQETLALLGRAGPAREIWAAAAVRERFKADQLLAQWLNDHPGTASGLASQAVDAVLDLKDVALPALNAEGDDALRLPSSVRFEVLRQIGVDAANLALEAVPAKEATGTEALLKNLLSNDTLKPNLQDRQQLYLLSNVADWAGAAGQPLDFDPSDLRRSMERLDFLQSLGGPDLSRFVGRQDELHLLHDLWRRSRKTWYQRAWRWLLRDYLKVFDQWYIWPPIPTAFIQGPGGMGKSLLIGRFVADLLELPRHEQPTAVFHLDFDRRDLQKARPAMILSEMTRQARRWVDPKFHEELAALERTTTFSRDIEQSSSRSSEAQGSVLTSKARQLVSLLQRNLEGSCRLLVVVDTLEQVIGFDDYAVASPGVVCRELERAGADVFCVYASRASLTTPPYGSRLTPVNLTGMSERDASLYVENESRRLGRTVTNDLNRKIQEAVGRSPLALRLAMALLAKEDEGFDADQWVVSLRDSPERIQAALYDRILQRIRDPNLRKIALPGLLVRRLTERVIFDVLAGPCDLNLTMTSPGSLMAIAESEGQLFVRDPSDPAALWHRSDVRALMLPDLDTTVPAELAEQINRAAVDFYSRTDDVISRTEELYHRLRLDEPEDVVRLRWTPEAGERLRTALSELPPRAQACARAWLGGASISAPNSTPSAGAAPREQRIAASDLRGIIRRELQSGTRGAMPLLRANGFDRLNGALGDIYAEALLSEGRYSELIRKTAAVKSFPLTFMPPQVRGGVFSVTAAALEGLGRLSEALSYWSEAQGLRFGDNEDERLLDLSTRIGTLRTQRKLDRLKLKDAPPAPEMPVDERRRTAIDQALTLAQSLETSVVGRGVVLRETVAELSEVLLRPNENRNYLLTNLLEHLFRMHEAFPSARADTARAAAIGIDLFESAMPPDALDDYAQKLVYGTSDQIAKLIAVLREEVDWTLARALERRSKAA